MYVTEIPNRNSPPAVLVRESYREGGKVKSRTIANVSKLPREAVNDLRRSLKGDNLVSAEDVFEITASFHHGHVDAVLLAMRRLGFANLVASRSSRERRLVLAMVAARILRPASKLKTNRWWKVTSLPATLGVADASEDDLYGAMDWLLKRQENIETKLASRHLQEDDMALYDLTSSYVEGITCPLAALGHNRDGKKGKLQINYGLLTDPRGCPVSVSVFEGNSGDPGTFLPQVEKIRGTFNIERMIMVGDRGMITQKQIDILRDIDGIDWVTALRSGSIKKLVEGGAIQMGLFDERNLFELSHLDYPGERLVACRNDALAKRRAHKRKSLLKANARELNKVRNMVEFARIRGKDEIGARVGAILRQYRISKHYSIDIRDDGFDFEVDEKGIAADAAAYGGDDPKLTKKRLTRYKRHVDAIAKKLEKVRQRTQQGRLYGKDNIGLRVGKVINKYKVGKHFILDIHDDKFDFEINQKMVTAEAALDGIYVVRTSLPEERMTANDTVRTYKLLSQVERAFRSIKTIDLLVRPIHHRLEDRVRAHIFICMLAFYVKWHMFEAWRPLLFADQDLQAKETRDPVAPAQRSEAALRKVHSRTLDEGSEAHSFQSLLDLLSSIVLNVCQVKSAPADSPTFDLITTPNAKQQRAFDLLDSITL